YLRDALEEIPDARAAITWIYGRYDDWVRPERAKNLMSVRSEMPREVLSIPTGHQMRNSEEAMEAFKLVTACLWRFFEGGNIRPFTPEMSALGAIRGREKERLSRRQDGDHKNFWREYLERKDRYLGFDIIRETAAYRDLMAKQLDLSRLRGGERLLDAGCGTGNFVQSLLERALAPERGLPMPAQVTLADYVPEALETARAKLDRFTRSGESSLPELFFRTVDLECSRFLPIVEALEGGGFQWDRARGTVEGLSGKLLDRLARGGDETALRVARGEDPAGARTDALSEAFGKKGAQALADLGRAARFVRGKLVGEDLRKPGSVDLAAPGAYWKLTAADLRWERLAFGSAGRSIRLPFEAGAFDRIVSSLVVCYLYRPEVTISEFYRVIAPGGVLVLSSMKPDADISRIYMRLIERLQSSGDIEIPRGLTREDLLNSARAFLNKAAGILNLEEDGAFEFLPKEDLVESLRRAGFRGIQVADSFGDPPQAYVLSGRRP
ncbi:MAG: methyltransferase domain-containing protein, partial [Myxococcota bacterium]